VLTGQIVCELGPRGPITIKDLDKLTLSYKGLALQHSLQTD